jgi:integrase/recombinase XerD
VTFFGKGGKTRTVPVSLVVIDEMLALRGPSAGPDSPVFQTQREGKRLSVRDAQRITAAARTDNDRASPHFFRHCHAITALDGGSPLPELQSQLGHEKLSTTGIYIHVRLGNGSANYIDI